MHHHHHLHNRHVHLHERQGVWDQFTSAAASAWNDAFPTSESKTKKAAGQSTIYRTVYTTMTPDGWEGTSLSTMAPVDPTTSTTSVSPKKTPTTEITTTTSRSPTRSPTTDILSTTSLPASISSTSESVPSTLVVATQTTSPRTFAQQTSTTTNAGAASATSSADAASNTGDPGTGAKAGIAIGVLGGILVVFLAVYFLFNRRRKQMEEKRRLEDDEKRNGPFADSHAIPGTPSTPANAPRLSLRPVTQFLPNLNSQQHPDRRASRGAAIAATLSPTQNTSRALTGNAMKPPMSSSSNHSANPFGNNAERIHSPISEEHRSVSPVSPISPMESDVGTAITTNSPPRMSPVASADNVAMAAGVGSAGVAAAAVGAAVGLARKTSIRKENAPKPLDLTRPMPPLAAVPASPAGTEFSVQSVSPGQSPGPSGSAAAIAADGGPAQSAVHRVQLDFKPTLEDEMELRAGHLVRLLHEYDDGWALCIRLDRSQQGVVPRTCLSTRPVKPRPAPGAGRPGPPINPNRGPGYPPANRLMAPQGAPHGVPHGGPPYPRPGSAQSQRQSPPGGQSMGPYGGRPASPGPRSMSPGPRAMSPAHGQRSQSPGPRYQQGRAQSPSGMNRRMSPPGQSPMNQEYRAGPPTGPVGRKPVPGQAS